MRLVKVVRLGYEASEELSALFEEFRLMCNDAIMIALTEKPKSKSRLIEIAYHQLKGYGLNTHYILSACEVAFSAFKNAKRKSSPYIRKGFIKLDNQSNTLIISSLGFRQDRDVSSTLLCARQTITSRCWKTLA